MDRLALRTVVAVAYAAVFLIGSAGAQTDPTIVLSVNNTNFRDGDVVQVSWSGVQEATLADCVALFVPANQSVNTVVPVKYKWVNTVPNWQSGKGSFTFKMLNQRQPAIFYYFRNLTSKPVDVSEGAAPAGFTQAGISAKSPVLNLAEPNEPTQIHMSLTNVSGEVILQWTSRDAGTPTARLGTQSGAYVISKTGSHVTYTPNDLCTSPANDTGYIFPGIFNRVKVTELQPNSKYFYTVGDPAFTFSPEYHFTTPPPVGPNSSVQMIIWADSGQAIDDGSDEWEWSDYDPIVTTPPNTKQAALASMVDVWQQDEAQQGASLNLTKRIAADMNDNITLLMHNGDLSYARGLVSAWDIFMDQYGFMKNAPYMVLPGNHERDCPNSGDRFWPYVSAGDSGGECGVPYELRYQMPIPAPGQQWYSFDHGPIHFLQTSTEQRFGAGSPQWIFVVNDLANVNRSLTPWVIVGFHRPFLTTSLYGHEFKSDIVVSDDLRNAFEDIFFQYQVDLTISGHVHLYSRSCAMFKKVCLGYNSTSGEANGPIHVDIGNGGFEFTWFSNPTPPEYWDAFAMEHGYTRVQANGTTFSMQAVSSDTGRIMDAFTLVKPVGWQPSLKAKTHFTDYFIANYTPSWIESPGLSSDAIWGSPIFLPAAEILQNNATALDGVFNLNATLLNFLNDGDSTPNIAQILQIYYQLFQQPAFANASRPAGDLAYANEYINSVFKPLFDVFQNQTQAQYASNGEIDAGLWRPARNAGSPKIAQNAQDVAIAGRRHL